MSKEHTLYRLNEIGQSLANSGHALALIGLGSVGVELARMDEYSDLDFYAIVETGWKQHYLQNLDWLSNIHPIAYYFQNTPDGHKLLFEDGVFCETAVFEPQELDQIHYAEGRIVWKKDEVDDSIRIPRKPAPQWDRPTTEWLVGEAVTCLYVGMGRYRRGEKLSAQRFIQNYAVDRILELSPRLEAEAGDVFRDSFSPERRYEKRFPTLAEYLPRFVQGYSAIPESARAILEFLDARVGVNQTLKAKILQLCNE